jgi:hypothetical protein
MDTPIYLDSNKYHSSPELVTYYIPLCTVAYVFLFKLLKKHTYFSNDYKYYFILHLSMSSYIFIATHNDAMQFLILNTKYYNKSFNLMPTVLQISFYTAHTIYEWDTISHITLAHHVLSSFLLGIIQLYFYSGPIVNCGLYFATGLPLFLSDMIRIFNIYNILTKSEAKLLSAEIESWIRMPGMLMTLFLLHSTTNYIPLWIKSLHNVFGGVNAIYFNNTIVTKNNDDDIRKFVLMISKIPLALFILSGIMLPYYI